MLFFSPPCPWKWWWVFVKMQISIFDAAEKPFDFLMVYYNHLLQFM